MDCDEFAKKVGLKNQSCCAECHSGDPFDADGPWVIDIQIGEHIYYICCNIFKQYNEEKYDNHSSSS